MEAKDIMRSLLEHLNMRPAAFAASIGAKTNQIIYDIASGKTKSISPSLANKITSCFPQVSRAWLLTGEGNMLKEDSSVPCGTQQTEFAAQRERKVDNGSNVYADVANTPTIELMRTMAEMNKQMLSTVMHMVDEQREATRKMMDLYDQMHVIQNEHNRASREHLDESIAELRRLRKDTFDKIDMLARESKRVLDENKMDIIKDCKTFDLVEYNRRNSAS